MDEFIGRDIIGIDQYAYEIDQTTRSKEGLRLPFVVTGIGPQNETLTVNYTNKELEEKGLSYIINGHHIHGFTNYKSNHPVKLMTLDEIRRKRCPQMKDEKVLYMINKFFILWEWEWYKVAEDFIWRVEVLPSYMLTPIQNNICEPFTIIRIFTKTHHNWMARMIEGGEDPQFIARRLVISAAEDIGLANPNALLLANAAFDAVMKIGWPEGRIPLAEAAVYLATSPKSNSAYMGINTALEVVKQTGNQPVPLHLRNAPTKLMKQLGYHDGYKYAHDYPGNFVNQQYMPDELKDTRLWHAQHSPSEA